jgi:hypothetical protein
LKNTHFCFLSFEDYFILKRKGLSVKGRIPKRRYLALELREKIYSVWFLGDTIKSVMGRREHGGSNTFS